MPPNPSLSYADWNTVWTTPDWRGNGVQVTDYKDTSGNLYTCIVLTSGTPGVFNLGGDLNLFKQLISARDRAGISRYGRACIDLLHRNYTGRPTMLYPARRLSRRVGTFRHSCVGSEVV